MRSVLAQRNGLRGDFTARFVRFGQKTAYKGPPIPTLLFAAVCDSTGAEVTDHLWFTTGRQWQRLALVPGDRVAFTARITPYTKGYRGRREADDLPPVTTDYKLSFPRHVRLLAPLARIQGLLF